MKISRHNGWIQYQSEQRESACSPAQFIGRYRPVGPVYQAEPGTLEAWLTERYCLYPVDSKGRVYRGEIHHGPWQLQRAEAEIDKNTLAAGLNLCLATEAPLLHFARRQDMVAWPLERLK